MSSEIYSSDDDMIYISDDEYSEISSIENESIESDQNNDSLYYHDKSQIKFQLKTPFDQKVFEVKKQIKFIEQRIKQSIESNDYRIVCNESNSDIDMNSNAVIDYNCCQIIDSNESHVSVNELLDSKSKQTYNELKKCYKKALDDMECDQTFDFDEWYLNLNYCFIYCVLNESLLNNIELAPLLNKLIQDFQSLHINQCLYLDEQNVQKESHVSVQTQIRGEIVTENFFIE